MKTIESVDQLYQLVLQHRAADVACFNWGLGTVILVVITVVLGLYTLIAADTYVEDLRKRSEAAQSGASAVVSGLLTLVASLAALATWSTYVDYSTQRALTPTDADLKLVGGYFTGEKVLSSDKFDKLSDAAILYLENQAKAEDSGSRKEESK